MKKLFVCFLIPLIGLFCSCNHSKKRVLPEFENIDAQQITQGLSTLKELPIVPSEIKITPSCQLEQIPVSEFADTVSFVKLETTSASIIGAVDKVIHARGCIYVLDRSKTRTLKVFSADGIYKGDIGKVGQGPGEYAELTDFFLLDGHILIYDQFGAKLNYYTMEGEYVKTKKLPFLCLQFYAYSSDNFIFHAIDADNQHLEAIDGYSVLQTDSAFHLKGKAFYREKERYSSIWIPDNFVVTDGRLFYHPPFSNRVYSIHENGTIQCMYHLDFGDKTLPERFLLSENWSDFQDETTQSSYFFFPGKYVELEDYFYFEYISNHLTHYCFYDKKAQKVISSARIKNDLLPIFPFVNIIGGMQNQLIGYVLPYDIVQAREHYGPAKWTELVGKQSAEMSHALREDDNPILVYFRCKSR